VTKNTQRIEKTVDKEKDGEHHGGSSEMKQITSTRYTFREDAASLHPQLSRNFVHLMTLYNKYNFLSLQVDLEDYIWLPYLQRGLVETHWMAEFT